MGLCSQYNTNNIQGCPPAPDSVSFSETGVEAPDPADGPPSHFQHIPHPRRDSCHEQLSTGPRGQHALDSLHCLTDLREVTPEPSPVDLRGQPSSCRGGAAQIVMLENGRSIAQTQHWHLCSTDYIISPWHLPVVIQDFRP